MKSRMIFVLFVILGIVVSLNWSSFVLAQNVFSANQLVSENIPNSREEDIPNSREEGKILPIEPDGHVEETLHPCQWIYVCQIIYVKGKPSKICYRTCSGQRAPESTDEPLDIK